MSAGRLKPHTLPCKLHASAQEQKELISQNVTYDYQKPLTLFLISIIISERDF